MISACIKALKFEYLPAKLALVKSKRRLYWLMGYGEVWQLVSIIFGKDGFYIDLVLVFYCFYRDPISLS